MPKARDYQTEYPSLEKTLEIIVNASWIFPIVSLLVVFHRIYSILKVLFHRKSYSIIPLESSTKSYAGKGAELTRTSVVYISKLLLRNSYSKISMVDSYSTKLIYVTRLRQIFTCLCNTFKWSSDEPLNN